ncbi:hypothetical protein Leryth_005469 [Lithospermum erythrorhizon]|nr:hypothetical protein Leryth_005469 [Lithospermum erythrorhizon]
MILRPCGFGMGSFQRDTFPSLTPKCRTGNCYRLLEAIEASLNAWNDSLFLLFGKAIWVLRRKVDATKEEGGLELISLKIWSINFSSIQYRFGVLSGTGGVKEALMGNTWRMVMGKKFLSEFDGKKPSPEAIVAKVKYDESVDYDVFQIQVFEVSPSLHLNLRKPTTTHRSTNKLCR